MENLATISPPGGPRPLPPGEIRLDQDQSLQSLEQIHSETDEMEVTEECPSRTQDDWVISMKDELKQLNKLDDMDVWSKLCIYKIPKYLHKMHDKSYSPQTVSIGPYHNGEKHLQSMESHKGRALNKILIRRKQCLELYIDGMRELEEKARACYEGVISMSSKDFTKMLVLDGCFVIEILTGALYGFVDRGYAPNDPIFALRESMHLIQRDMMMLENQLPLFILQRLSTIEGGIRETPTYYLPYLAISFFDPLILKDSSLKKASEMFDEDEEMAHFLDIFRQNLALPNVFCGAKWIRPSRVLVVDKRPQHMIHCVMKLRDVGINFKKRDTETNHFWDIRFENGYLEIPKIFIHEGTKSLFLNLIAFEQCHRDSSIDITSYIMFMDNLIDSAEDVSYLQKCGIIEHWLESNSEVADLFNQIGRQGIVFDNKDSYLYSLSLKVRRYYRHRNKFRKWYASIKTLKEKYFDSPWAYISFLAAITLLVLTFFQCYYAAYAYYNPSS